MKRIGGASPRGLLICALLSGIPWSTAAQQARPAPFAIDTVATVEESVDTSGNAATGVFLDAVLTVGVGRGFEAITWPIVQRQANSGEWTGDIWIGALRYERAGRVGIRIDGGLIPAPIGLANLTVRRPHLNPTISQPGSLFTTLPVLELRGPRTNLLGAVYPFGGQVTVSGTRWDMRAAVIDTSPLRRRKIISDVNPPRFGNVVVGGGVTPVIGLRVGASMSRGGWARAGEAPTITTNQGATVVTVEAEFAFAFTKVAAEWVRDAVETSAGTQIATGWFVQGHHTLAPRWFAAARAERMHAPAVLATLIADQQFTTVEEVLGFRLTPEFTVRGGHRARRGFGSSGFVHQVEMSLVWWKRWM